MTHTMADLSTLGFETESVGHALWIAGWLLIAAAFFGLALVGMVRMTKGALRAGQRHGWRDRWLIALTIAAALLAFMGGWLIYVAWWPFARVLRPFPRLHMVGPAVGVVLLLSGIGALLNVIAPTAHPTWINDTGQSVTISGCTDDPAFFQADELSSGPFVSVHARSCYVYLDYRERPSGCLWLPAHLSDTTVIRLSTYVPVESNCP
jgi:hypothetical protein